MRFAGTWKQYSPNAINQLATIATMRGADLYFRCPYHANVMNVFEMSRRAIVDIRHVYRRVVHTASTALLEPQRLDRVWSGGPPRRDEVRDRADADEQDGDEANRARVGGI